MTTETLGTWLTRHLARREWSQADLARKSGLSSGRISEWVRGTRFPNPESCARLASALGVDLDEALALAGHRPARWGDEDRQVAALVTLVRKVRWDDRTHACIRAALEALIAANQQEDTP